MDPSHHVNRQTFVYNLFFFFFATAFGIMADRDVVDLEGPIEIDDGPAVAGSASTPTAPSSTSTGTVAEAPASPAPAAVANPGLGIK